MELLSYFTQLFTPETLLWITIGATVGVILGALPGMSATTGITIFMPLTFSLPPVTALSALGAIYVTGAYGGNITAVLINTPGTSDSLFMTWDGYPMTLKGQGLKAIGVTTITSFAGGVIGCLALLLIAPQLAKIAVIFGPFEQFLTVLMGIIIIIGLVKDNAMKGIMSACLGFLCSMIGLDNMTAESRFSFGIPAIADELPMIPLVLGMFAISQVFILAAENRASVVIGNESLKGSPWLSGKELKQLSFETLRSSVIGTVVGIIPAAGTTIAAGLSYNLARRADPDPSSFGKGNPKGLAVTSASNNAVVGGSMVPLLTLGIPGNGTSALFLTGLYIHGLAPGNKLFTDNAQLAYGLIFAFLLANVFILVFGMFGARLFAKITKLPSNILIPVIAGLCVLGAYSYRCLASDLVITMVFGVIGYYMMRAQVPVAPFVLAFVLGRTAELNLRRSMLLMKGHVLETVFQPLPLVLILIDVIMLIAPFWGDICGALTGKKKGGKAA